MQPAVAGDIADSRTLLGKFVAVAKRMSEVSANISDAYRLALDGDRAGDQGRKLTFRSQLQQSLMLCAEALLAGDECVTDLARDWQVRPATQTTAPASTTVQASLNVPTPRPVKTPTIQSREVVAALLLGEWKVEKTNGYRGTWTFTSDGKVTNSDRHPKTTQWKIESGAVMIRWNDKVWESLTLPIDPAGSTGPCWQGTAKAVKVAWPAPTPAVVTPLPGAQPGQP